MHTHTHPLLPLPHIVHTTTMSGIPAEVAALLASINARLGAIEAAIAADSAGAAGETLCRVASDFDATIVKGAGAKAVEAAAALGDDGKKLVRRLRARAWQQAASLQTPLVLPGK